MNSLPFSHNQEQVKNNFRRNIMLILRQCPETDALVVTQEKCKFPNYQEHWSLENCTFKGCPFRITKFVLLNTKLLKH